MHTGQAASAVLDIGSVVLDVLDLPRALAFWTRALGYGPRDGAPGHGADFVVLSDTRRPWANVSLQFTDEPKRHVNRVHLDLYADDALAEVERLETLGARRIRWEYPPEPDFIVMVDTEGNEFCVVQRPTIATGGEAR